MTHVANDAIDLMYDLLLGRGRPAFKTARSLYEHQVAAELILDPVMARRYLDHDAVGRSYFGDLVRLEEHLRGKDLKAYRHRRRKIERDTKAAVAHGMAKYGASFRRGWAPGTLLDNAKATGRDSDYAFYKAASLPTHGAIAGLFGARMEDGSSSIYRTGPALAACTLAGAYGLTFVEMALTSGDSIIARGALDEWRRRHRDLISELPTYIAAVEKTDADLWSEHVPINAAPMVVVDSYQETDLWLVMPAGGLAYSYDGGYATTPEQHATYEKLIHEVLPTLKVERLGLMLLDAGGLDFRKAAFDQARGIRDVVAMGVVGIDQAGVVHVEHGMKAQPFLDDLLGGA